MAAFEGQIAALRDVVQAGQTQTQEKLDLVLDGQDRHSSDLARLHEKCNVLQAEKEVMQARIVHLEERVMALEQAPPPPPPPPSPFPSPGLGGGLDLRYLLEGSADQQRQREELGKIALSPPPGRDLAGVAADLGVDLGRLSQQGGGKVVILNLGSAKSAQAWLNHFRAVGGSGYTAWRSCTLLQQMRGKGVLHRLCHEVQKLGVRGLNAFVSKNRCDLLLSWAPVEEVLYHGAPHTVYPAWKHLQPDARGGFQYRRDMHCLEHVRLYAQQALAAAGLPSTPLSHSAAAAAAAAAARSPPPPSPPRQSAAAAAAAQPSPPPPPQPAATAAAAAAQPPPPSPPRPAADAAQPPPPAAAAPSTTTQPAAPGVGILHPPPPHHTEQPAHSYAAAAAAAAAAPSSTSTRRSPLPAAAAANAAAASTGRKHARSKDPSGDTPTPKVPMTRMRARLDQGQGATAEEEIRPNYAPYDQDDGEYGGDVEGGDDEGSDDDPEFLDPEEAEVGLDQTYNEWKSRKEKKGKGKGHKG